MRICHLSSSYDKGGAARAMQRLHVGLTQQNVDSIVFSPDSSEGVKFVPGKKLIQKTKRWAYKKRIKREWEQNVNKLNSYDLFTNDRTPYREDLLEQLPEADIYHIHWISRFLDITTFFEQVNKPIVWTFHDMNPFTGGCHYDDDCGKYAEGCGACPQLSSNRENDFSKTIFERKKKTLAPIPTGKFRAVGDSNWISSEARKSEIYAGKQIDTIHYGLDHHLFKPMDKNSIHNLLEIPHGRSVILFGAPGVENKRKGFQELREAMEILRKTIPDLFLLTFGGDELPDDLGADHLHLGHISNDRYLAMLYNAADVFVIPSLQEAFGQTCLEAMACGVPCAGFNTGGIPDMIKPSETGWLAETGNPESLAKAIEKTLEQKDILGNNARAMVETLFTLRNQAKAYIDVYNELLKNVS